MVGAPVEKRWTHYCVWLIFSNKEWYKKEEFRYERTHSPPKNLCYDQAARECVEGLCWGQRGCILRKSWRGMSPPCLPSFWPCWEIEMSKIFLFMKEALMGPSLTLTDKLCHGFPSWWVGLSWVCPRYSRIGLKLKHSTCTLRKSVTKSTGDA